MKNKNFSGNKRTNLLQSYISLDFDELTREEQSRRCYLLNKQEGIAQVEIARLLNISQQLVSVLVREYEN